MEWVEIPAIYLQVQEKVQLVRLAEVSFCLVYHQGEWFAFSKKCPHAGAPLVDGWCEDGFVVCPYHRQKFNLHSGKGLVGQGNYITVYPLRFENGIGFVGLKKRFCKRVFG